MPRMVTSHRRNRFTLIGGAALAVALAGGVIGPVYASTEAPAALASGCVQLLSTDTCSYAPTGVEQQFTVPAGVTDLHIAAVGSAGQYSTYLGTTTSGGVGALATADLPVTAGQNLYVEVGGAGSGAAGGFNGGGGGAANGQGGGGASDVRACSIAATSCPGGGVTLDSRLLVAAGGGGAGGGGDAPGGAGGNAGTSPQPGGAGTGSLTTFGGGGGGGATATAGGVGGIGAQQDASSSPGNAGASGAQGSGGTVAHDVGAGSSDPRGATGGGGGGGGWFGGGGAGSGSDHYIFTLKGVSIVFGAGGGGGAGSSYLAPAATNAAISTDPGTGAPSVTITYRLPTPALADAPSIGAAIAGDGSASINFSAPTSDGNSPITGYLATATPGDGGTPVTGVGTTEPITLPGLTNRTTYTVTVAAINTVGTGPASASSNPFMPVAPLQIITPSPLPTFPIDKPISMVLNASGGTGLFTWSVLPGDNLPAGLTLGASGVIYGTPTTAGTNQQFSVRVADVAPQQQAAIQLMIMTINPAPISVPAAPTIGAATPGDAFAAVAFTAPAIDGGAPITGYTVTSAPEGRTATGTVSPITVTGLSNGIAYTFTVTATNSAGTGPASAASTPATPVAALTLTTSTLATGTVGADYTAALTATGGTRPYTWSLSPGASLTSGLTLHQNGTLTGAPSAAGNHSTTVQVRDTHGQTASAQLSITINPAPKLPDLAVSLTPTGRFVTGALGLYRVQVTNTENTATTRTTTLTTTMARGLVPRQVTASGWTCIGHGRISTCTHTGLLGAHVRSAIVLPAAINAPAGTVLVTTVIAGPADATPADNTTTNHIQVQRK